VDLELFHVADDEEGRVLQGLAVPQELVVGGAQLLVLALVLPGEVVRFHTSAQPSPPPYFWAPFSKV
jgi:hypothetical protein